jgi:hypothetical protein
MFDKLKNKWGVNGVRVLLILCTFAIGGSLSGRVAHYFLELLEVENMAVKVIVYLLLVTILWPISVLLVSLLFGQFNFFRKYLSRIGKRMFGSKNNKDEKQFSSSVSQ